MRYAVAGAAVVLVLVAAACGGDDAATTAEDTTETVTTEAPATEPATEAAETEAAGDDAATGEGSMVVVSSSDLGDVLTDADGMTLYLFRSDEQGGPSTCYDDCEASWPPLLGPAEAGEGVDAGLLGTVARDDGSEQVTYDGWPLYYFAGDTAPGDAKGQGLGDVWFAVDASGEAVTQANGGASAAY